MRLSEEAARARLRRGREQGFEQQRELLADKAISARTAADYRRDLSTMFRVLGATRVSDIKEDEFLCLMMHMAEIGYSAGRLEKFRSALAHFQVLRVTERAQFTQTARFRKQFAGAQTLCKAVATRGAITADKCLQVVELAPHAYKFGFILAYHALLRHSELLSLRKCDCVVENETLWVRVIGPKGHKAQKGKSARCFRTEIPGFAGCFHAWCDHLEGPDLLVPGWNMVAANKIIAQCATIHKWDKSLQWSFHCLRHGAATDMVTQGIDVLTRRRLGRWSSERMADWYARTPVGEE